MNNYTNGDRAMGVVEVSYHNNLIPHSKVIEIFNV